MIYWKKRVGWIAGLALLAAFAVGCSAATTDAGVESAAEAEEEHDHPDTPTPPAEESGGASETGGAAVPDISEVAVPIEGFDHIPQGETAVYDHYPPSSGQHWGVTAEWGIYANPVPPEVWVHNLEHSGIVLLYNCPDGCPDLVEDLTNWSRNAPDSKWGYPKILMFPDDRIESQIVALAWGWQLDMDRFDGGMLNVFYTRHIDNGPEDVP
jgi:hypothetical protein